MLLDEYIAKLANHLTLLAVPPRQTGPPCPSRGAPERRVIGFVRFIPLTHAGWEWLFDSDGEHGISSASLRVSRLTLIYGASGVGKSSVMRAAVVPFLRMIVPAPRAALFPYTPLFR